MTIQQTGAAGITGALMTEKATCGNCRFYLRVNADPKVPGVCRRFPPMVFSGDARGQPGWLSQYPPLYPDGWCGEHKPALAS